ncbi:hypothetical protein HZA44_02270 [Candidatus Peregrinibacteria bacterium]|nr:hypothetical protein [Candidatus Peregrinibacteria bacterium]
MTFYPNKHGAIGILTALVMGLVLVMVAVTLVLTGISSRQNAFLLSQSEKTLISTEGCADEALIQLSRNHAYLGGPLSQAPVACTVAIQGNGDTRDVLVTGSHGVISRNLLIRISFVPSFHITQWVD